MKRKFNNVDMANEMRCRAIAAIDLVCLSLGSLRFDVVCLIGS
jgi:hypothetical protein